MSSGPEQAIKDTKSGDALQQTHTLHTVVWNVFNLTCH